MESVILSIHSKQCCMHMSEWQCRPALCVGLTYDLWRRRSSALPVRCLILPHITEYRMRCLWQCCTLVFKRKTRKDGKTHTLKILQLKRVKSASVSYLIFKYSSIYRNQTSSLAQHIPRKTPLIHITWLNKTPQDIGVGVAVT